MGESRRVFLRFLGFFEEGFRGNYWFSIEQKGRFGKMSSGFDRARRVLLGELMILIGERFMTNLSRKDSNPKLRYPT